MEKTISNTVIRSDENSNFLIYENQNKASTGSYFFDRMKSLGITDDANLIKICLNDPNNNLSSTLTDQTIFRQHELGIEIMVYDLDRHYINYEPPRKDPAKREWKKRWSIIRLEKPEIKIDGSIQKYKMPKGAGSQPFFPPSLIEKFESKTIIDTLFLTEGFFKAFKAHLHGIACVGLPSITHIKDRETGGLHQDIKRLIETCQVQKVVWLVDGDCLNLSQTLVEENGKPKDISNRPFNFFNSISTFHDLFDEYKTVNKYFMHINSDEIEGTPKGIDDLLIQKRLEVEEIVADIHNVSKPGKWFTKINITFGVGKAYKYFHLDHVDNFYLYHVDRRSELKGLKDFKFRGTIYSWNEKENKCDVVIPADASKYFRVADTYYKFVEVPNQYKKIEKRFEARLKTTIVDDHGKNFIKHIEKLEAFCNVPDNTHYAQKLHNCFNVYSPLDYNPEEDNIEEDDCKTIIYFLKHIFGEQPITSKINDEEFRTTTFDLGMDYVQLLYKQPWQKLPVLCLVSKENSTGKTTMANFLRSLLGANVAIVGNQDLSADFNAHWATKLVVVCDETKIDKQHVVEKVKMLSTAKKVIVNAKGRNQVEIDCFLKFVLISNNEENFIYAGDDDIRFWIIKVPKLKIENPHILTNIIEEIPSFMSYLNKRQLSTSNQSRMWFHPQLLKTEALKKVIAHSRPAVEKELRQFLRELWEETEGEGYPQEAIKSIKNAKGILMTRKAIHKECFNNRYEASYIEKILKENLKIGGYSGNEPEGLSDDSKKGNIKTRRTSYYKYDSVSGQYFEVKENGRPYLIKREHVFSSEELQDISNADLQEELPF